MNHRAHRTPAPPLPSRRFVPWTLSLAAILTLCCAPDSQVDDPDAGESLDAAAASTDAGPSEDSGAQTLDAGVIADAGELVDAGGSQTRTDAVLCGLQGAGDQRLEYTTGRNNQPVDETLAYRFEWLCDASARRLTANGVPNHAVTSGRFATPLSAQNVAVSFTLQPEVTDQATGVREAGYALNGVKFDPATAGSCPDTATSDADCNYAMGQDMWKMVATPGDTSPWRFSFGVDVNDAHVQPSGAYHYHGNPVLLVESLNPAPDTSMTLVGWAMDGFPIYSLYGHSDPADSSSSVTKMRSSYQTIATPQLDRPSTTDFPMGHFESDWEYIEGSGDLDECNGRLGVTPDFPGGIYYYVITDTYPFVQRCVKGR